MKCSSCYAENAPWATLCSTCGNPTLALELCPNGHLLAPGQRDCAVCPSAWPEVPPFQGPPVLRGLLWVERGDLVGSANEGSGERLYFCELRDREASIALGIDARGRARLLADDDPETVARLVVRPSGFSLCRRGGRATRPGPLAYEPLHPGSSFDLENVRLRLVTWEIPAFPEGAR